MDILCGEVTNSKFSSMNNFFHEDDVGFYHVKNHRWPIYAHLESIDNWSECKTVDVCENFWLGRTLSIRKVGFENRVKIRENKLFWHDAYGLLATAKCTDPSISTTRGFNDLTPFEQLSESSIEDFYEFWRFRSGLTEIQDDYQF